MTGVLNVLFIHILKCNNENVFLSLFCFYETRHSSNIHRMLLMCHCIDVNFWKHDNTIIIININNNNNENASIKIQMFYWRNKKSDTKEIEMKNNNKKIKILLFHVQSFRYVPYTITQNSWLWNMQFLENNDAKLMRIRQDFVLI